MVKEKKLGFWDRFNFYNENKIGFKQIVEMERLRKENLKKQREDEQDNK